MTFLPQMASMLTGSFSRLIRELSSELSVRIPITIIRLWRGVCRPWGLGLIGAAIAVFLWGVGSKLSLCYEHRDASTRVSIARMWIEPRSSSIRAGFGSGAKAQLASGSNALSVPFRRLPRLGGNIVRTALLCPQDGPSFFGLPSLRSPPPHRFFPA